MSKHVTASTAALILERTKEMRREIEELREKWQAVYAELDRRERAERYEQSAKEFKSRKGGTGYSLSVNRYH